MGIAATQLSPTLGAELHGFDPRAVSEADKAEIRALFARYHLLLIRGAHFRPEEQVAFSEIIGPISSADAIMKDGRKFTHISNVHADGRLPAGELLYHSDHMFLPQPLKAISLNALEVPAVGGETRWKDTTRVYRALPEELKQRIAGLQARFVYDYGANIGNKAPKADQLGSNSDQCIHPLVWHIAETGETVLFVCRLFVTDIIGLPEAEGSALLEELFQAIEAGPDDYAHRWEVGDFIIWDNRCTQHARNDFPATEKRALRRVPVA